MRASPIATGEADMSYFQIKKGCAAKFSASQRTLIRGIYGKDGISGVHQVMDAR